MRSIAIAAFAAVVYGSVAFAAMAGEQLVELKKGAGLDKVETNCAVCHTLDYIRMNSPFLNAAGWDAEVTKMISVFGAPISPDDARIIGDYLKANYGQ